MKKTLLIVLSLFLVLSLVVSCEYVNKLPDSSASEKPDAPPAEDKPDVPPAEESDSVEVVVLDFFGDESSRAITAFPDDIPFYSIEDGQTVLNAKGQYYDNTTYGFWMSCNVMRSLPIFPGLKSVNANANAYINSIKNKHLKGYGFDLYVRIAEVTEDGVFISYDIRADEKVSGTIEYYYSIKDKKFSYREIVMPLLGKTGGDQIFVFEMLNVPVTKEGNDFSFRAGELYDNGSSFNHLTFVNGNYAPMGPVSESDIRQLQFEDAKIAMNYQGNTVYSAEYEKYYLHDYSLTLKDLIGKESISLNDENRKTYSMGKILWFLRSIYEDTFEKHEFSTIDDFNATALKIREEKKTVLYRDDVSNYKYHGLSFPLSFNLKENIGACIYHSNAEVVESAWSDQFTDISKRNFEKCLDTTFNDFDQFVSVFLEKLGLSESLINDRKTLLKDSYNVK
ncbi:MAG: hypothetical protein ACI4NM_01055 [Bullifex sp.]